MVAKADSKSAYATFVHRLLPDSLLGNLTIQNGR